MKNQFWLVIALIFIALFSYISFNRIENSDNIKYSKQVDKLEAQVDSLQQLVSIDSTKGK